MILSCLFGSLSVLAIAFLFYCFGVTAGLKLDSGKLALSTSLVRIYDGEEQEISVSAEKNAARFQDLPSYLPNAFVAVEDKRFYSHNGFDYRRIAKAFLKNAVSFSFKEGASTISQQLVKNTHLSGEKTVKRKLKEFKLTRALEKHYTKEEILELYLNSIYFGHSAFGIENAASFYFGKNAAELSPAESAMLAALVKSPNRYSPFRDAEKCLTRRNFILSLMRDQNFIAPSEYEEAVKEPLPTAPAEKDRTAYSYLSAVYEELSELFPDLRSGEIGEWKVYTALDGTLQETLETTKEDSDVCILVRDNQNNAIKALYSTAGIMKRLPASTIKPLLVYAPAIEENFISPATPVLDEKINYAGYSPSNYGGEFGGYMSVRYALAHSVNIPAVKILNEIGIPRGCSYLERMGLSVPEEDYSLALALGGMRKGFTLPALADAFSVFAAGGTFTPARTILRIVDSGGTVVYRHRPAAKRVFSEETSYLINDMLQTAASEGTAKTLKSLHFPVCAKTGTGANGKDTIDAYTIAYTTEHTVAVWLGNKDNTPIFATGGGIPANIALKTLRALYRDGAPSPFPACGGIEKVSYDKEEYETHHRILRADSAAPPLTTLSDYFKTSALPEGKSTRFSRPTIQIPKISINNGSICIVLSQTEYYDYVIKRKNNGEEITVYSGKYREKIYDNSVLGGEIYEYTVTPFYGGTAGETVRLPAVRIPVSPEIPDDWWVD